MNLPLLNSIGSAAVMIELPGTIIYDHAAKTRLAEAIIRGIAVYARHEIALRLHECIHTASSLLRSRGRFCIIYHPCRLSELMDVMRREQLETKRIRFVHSTPSSEARIVLLEAVKGGRVELKDEEPFYLYREEGRYTEEMERIYRV